MRPFPAMQRRSCGGSCQDPKKVESTEKADVEAISDSDDGWAPAGRGADGDPGPSASGDDPGDGAVNRYDNGDSYQNPRAVFWTPPSHRIR